MNHAEGKLMKLYIFIATIMIVTIFSIGCNSSMLSSLKDETERRDRITSQVKIDNPPIALVNGKKIIQNDIMPILMAGYGKQVLDKYTELLLVRTHAQSVGIPLDDTIADLELNKLLLKMAPNQNQTQRYGLLKYILKRRSISLGELKMVLETTALLKQIVLMEWEPQEINNDTIRAQYVELYGNQVTIKILTTATQREIDACHNFIKLGGDFYEIAKAYSQDQISLTNNSEMGPFTLYTEDVPQHIREQAFMLQKDNETSAPFQYYDDKHIPYWAIIKRISTIAQKDIAIASVKTEIKDIIHQKRLNAEIATRLKSIKTNARITILDDTLRKNTSNGIMTP